MTRRQRRHRPIRRATSAPDLLPVWMSSARGSLIADTVARVVNTKWSPHDQMTTCQHPSKVKIRKQKRENMKVSKQSRKMKFE